MEHGVTRYNLIDRYLDRARPKNALRNHFFSIRAIYHHNRETLAVIKFCTDPVDAQKIR